MGSPCVGDSAAAPLVSREGGRNRSGEPRLNAVHELCQNLSSPGSPMRSDAWGGPATAPTESRFRASVTGAQEPTATCTLFPSCGPTPMLIWKRSSGPGGWTGLDCSPRGRAGGTGWCAYLLRSLHLELGQHRGEGFTTKLGWCFRKAQASIQRTEARVGQGGASWAQAAGRLRPQVTAHTHSQETMCPKRRQTRRVRAGQ